MPKYQNTTKEKIVFTDIDGKSVTIESKKELVTMGIHNIKGLKEVSPFPFYTPVIKEDWITGRADSFIKVSIYDVTNSFYIENESNNNVELYYNDTDTQGITLKLNNNININLTDPQIKESIKCIYIKLKENLTDDNKIIRVVQFR